jgi:hypothetical protein
VNERAQGGPIPPGQVYMIGTGEREMWVPAEAGKIVPWPIPKPEAEDDMGEG